MADWFSCSYDAEESARAGYRTRFMHCDVVLKRHCQDQAKFFRGRSSSTVNYWQILQQVAPYQNRKLYIPLFFSYFYPQRKRITYHFSKSEGNQKACVQCVDWNRLSVRKCMIAAFMSPNQRQITPTQFISCRPCLLHPVWMYRIGPKIRNSRIHTRISVIPIWRLLRREPADAHPPLFAITRTGRPI
jgi:hypothetical protein